MSFKSSSLINPLKHSTSPISPVELKRLTTPFARTSGHTTTPHPTSSQLRTDVLRDLLTRMSSTASQNSTSSARGQARGALTNGALRMSRRQERETHSHPQRVTGLLHTLGPWNQRRRPLAGPCPSHLAPTMPVTYPHPGKKKSRCGRSRRGLHVVMAWYINEALSWIQRFAPPRRVRTPR